ncbi:hypothetical protein B0H14DRAFT_2563267 [Mycena olivaceomarginata]|nr:hypothetical protein B0H14DRAFT_2563267 [Mycena olivaceomarginata]
MANFRLDGIQWPKNGNLTVNFKPDSSTIASRMTQIPAIWAAIRPLLGFAKNHECPRVDAGGAWHSVIIHDVPLIKDELPRGTPSLNIGEWLKMGGLQGSVEAVSILCKEEDQEKRETVPCRISLQSKTDADFLVENGALLFGSRCRVSHFRPPHSLSSRTWRR